MCVQYQMLKDCVALWWGRRGYGRTKEETSYNIPRQVSASFPNIFPSGSRLKRPTYTTVNCVFDTGGDTRQPSGKYAAFHRGPEGLRPTALHADERRSAQQFRRDHTQGECSLGLNFIRKNFLIIVLLWQVTLFFLRIQQMYLDDLCCHFHFTLTIIDGIKLIRV